MGHYDSCYDFEQYEQLKQSKPFMELFRSMEIKDSGEYYILGPEKVHMDNSLLPLRYNSEYGATQGAKELAAKFKCNYTVVKAVAIVEMPAEPTVRKL
jgi:hypothetical protein